MRGHRFVRGGAPLFDPSTLTLSGWNKANYTGAPWADSNGTGHPLNAGTAPSTGTAVNGLTPATFNGTTQFLTGSALSTFMGGTGFSGWALVNISAISSAGLTLPANNNDMLFCSSGTGVWGIIFNSTGPTVTHHVLNGSGSDFGATASISTGAWQLIQWSFDATNISIRVNGGSRVNTACTSIFSLTAALDCGKSVSAAKFFNGSMLECGFRAGATIDSDFDNVRSYILGRYGITV